LEGRLCKGIVTGLALKQYRYWQEYRAAFLVQYLLSWILSNYYWSWQQAQDSKVKAEDRELLVYTVSYINTASYSLESQILLESKTKNLGISLYYILIDSVLFYIPPPMSTSQPTCSSGIYTAFLLPVGPFLSFTVTGDSIYQTALQYS
jgi:hypothetical protein